MTSYYTKQQHESINRVRLPKHVAIIPDGNRRWARQSGLMPHSGHQRGGDNLIEIVKAARELGIKIVTFYLFSTENWSRSPYEINILMHLIEHLLKREESTLLEYGVKLDSIGEPSRLPLAVQNAVAHAKSVTAECTDITMVMALNYGSRDEICRAARSIATSCVDGKLSPEQIDSKLFSEHLDTTQWADPELLIRTSGEQRLSNYLLWQLSYAEFYVTDCLWPDFEPVDLLKAVQEYQNRKRRLGGNDA